jgi:hypothetical protein
VEGQGPRRAVEPMMMMKIMTMMMMMIAEGNKCVFAVQKILNFRMMSRNGKFLIHKTIIIQVVT